MNSTRSVHIVAAIAAAMLVGGVEVPAFAQAAAGRSGPAPEARVSGDGKNQGPHAGAPRTSAEFNVKAIPPSWQSCIDDPPVSGWAALTARRPIINDVLVDATARTGGILCAVSSQKPGEPTKYRLERIDAGTGRPAGANCPISHRVAAFAVGASATDPIWLADAGTRCLLTAWDFASGAARWQVPVCVDPTSCQRPWVVGDDVLLTEPGVGLQCFSAKDGRERWRLLYPAGGRIASASDGFLLWAQPKGAVVVTNSGSRVSGSSSAATTSEVAVVDVAAGKVARTIQTKSLGTHKSAGQLADDGMLRDSFSLNKGMIRRLNEKRSNTTIVEEDARTGRIAWEIAPASDPVGGSIGRVLESFVSAGDSIYYSTAIGEVGCLKVSDAWLGHDGPRAVPVAWRKFMGNERRSVVPLFCVGVVPVGNSHSHVLFGDPLAGCAVLDGASGDLAGVLTMEYGPRRFCLAGQPGPFLVDVPGLGGNDLRCVDARGLASRPRLSFTAWDLKKWADAVRSAAAEQVRTDHVTVKSHVEISLGGISPFRSKPPTGRADVEKLARETRLVKVSIANGSVDVVLDTLSRTVGCAVKKTDVPKDLSPVTVEMTDVSLLDAIKTVTDRAGLTYAIGDGGIDILGKKN